MVTSVTIVTGIVSRWFYWLVLWSLELPYDVPCGVVILPYDRGGAVPLSFLSIPWPHLTIGSMVSFALWSSCWDVTCALQACSYLDAFDLWNHCQLQGICHVCLGFCGHSVLRIMQCTSISYNVGGVDPMLTFRNDGICRLSMNLLLLWKASVTKWWIVSHGSIVFVTEQLIVSIVPSRLAKSINDNQNIERS